MVGLQFTHSLKSTSSPRISRFASRGVSQHTLTTSLLRDQVSTELHVQINVLSRISWHYCSSILVMRAEATVFRWPSASHISLSWDACFGLVGSNFSSVLACKQLLSWKCSHNFRVLLLLSYPFRWTTTLARPPVLRVMNGLRISTLCWMPVRPSNSTQQWMELCKVVNYSISMADSISDRLKSHTSHYVDQWGIVSDIVHTVVCLVSSMHCFSHAYKLPLIRATSLLVPIMPTHKPLTRASLNSPPFSTGFPFKALS